MRYNRSAIRPRRVPWRRFIDPSPPRDRTDAVVAAGLAVLLVFAALAWGAYDLWSATLVETVVVVLFCAVLVCRRGPGRDALDLPFLPLILLALAAFAASARLAARPGEAWIHFHEWTAAFLAFMLAAAAFGDERNLSRLRRAAVAIAVVECVVAGSQYFTVELFPAPAYNKIHEPQKWGTFVNPNFMAAFLLPWIPVFAAHVIDTWRGPRRIAAGSLIGLVSALAALAFARSAVGWLCVFLCIPALALLFLEKRAWARVALSPASWIAALGLAAVAGFIVYHKVQNPFVTTTVAEPQSSFGRVDWWRTAVAMAKANPWFGVGLGNYASGFLAFKVGAGEHTRFAHSFFFKVLGETGAAGTAALALFHAAVLRAVAGSWPRLGPRRAHAIGWGALFVFAQVSLGLETLANLLLYFVFLGILAAPMARRPLAVPLRWKAVLAAGIAGGLAFLVAPFAASRHVAGGEALLREERYGEAAAAFEAAKSVFPSSGAARRGLAAAHFGRYRMTGEAESLERAVAAQGEAVRLNRLDAEWWWEWGRYLETAGEGERALAAYEEAARFHGTRLRYAEDRNRLRKALGPPLNGGDGAS